MGSAQTIVAWCSLSLALLAACESGPAPCASGELACGAACTDLTSDHDHCGSCDVACGAGQVCVNGACAADCGAGTTKCGDRCFDIDVDPRNCGACGVVCPATNVCNHGGCSSSCDENQLVCAEKDGNHCVDVASDNANCGGCGVACGAQQVCAAGICASTCVDKQTLCTPEGEHAYCAWTATDSANCGSCGNVCDPTLSCIGGACAPNCSIGLAVCPDQNAQLTCVDPFNDPTHCGSCTTNCGSDGYCSFGSCQCLGGKRYCDGACTDTQSDSNHCGSCFTTCGGGVCSRGRCVIDIVSPINFVIDMVMDDTHVYVATGGEIASIPNGGGSTVNLTSGYTAAGSLVALAADASNIYFTDRNSNGSRLCSVPKTGGTVSVLATVADYLSNIAVDATNVYSRGTNAIVSVPIGGGSVVTLGPGDGTAWFAPAIASDGTTVYWLIAPGIVSTPVGGGAITTQYSGGAENLLVSGSTLFFESGALFEMTSQTSPQPIALNIFAYALSSSYIFASDGLTISRIDPKNTFNVTPIVDATITSFAASLTYVTWWDSVKLHQVAL